MVCAFSGSGRPISRLTAWPTISSVSLAASTPRVATVPTLALAQNGHPVDGQHLVQLVSDDNGAGPLARMRVSNT